MQRVASVQAWKARSGLPLRARLGLGLAALALCGSGCANHIRSLDVQNDESHSERTERRVVFRSAEGDLLREARVELEVYALERFLDTRHSTLTRYEESTPYSSLRELYEVPTGLVSVPLSLGFHLVRVATFFYIPREPVVAYTDYTFASLNPAMNVEDPERVVRVQLEVESEEPESSEREVRRPLRHRTVHARLDDADAVALRTDSEGVLAFHLLDLVTDKVGPHPRKVVLAVESPQASGSVTLRELFIERGLAQRVGESRRFLVSRRDQPGAVGTLSEIVYAIDRLGFEEYSLRLEDEIARHYRDEPLFLLHFHEALRGLYDANAPLPALAPSMEADSAGGALPARP